VVARRPGDRKSQIEAAAAALFLQRGYHNVSVTDVAGRLGITAPALYHHYRDKQDLLHHVVLDGLDAVDALITRAASLDDALRSLVTFVLGPRRLLALWEREARHLRGPRRDAIRAREVQVAANLARLLRAARMELDAADAELIAWALLGTLGSRARWPSGRTLPEDARLLYRLGMATAYCGLAERGPSAVQAGAEVDDRPETPALKAAAEPAAGTRTGSRPSRRDQLLTEAVVMFGERGFQSVSMADIGRAAGIATSGIYRHFPSKTDLLVSASRQGVQRMCAETDRALSAARDPREALEFLLRAHIRLTMEFQHHIGIATDELAQLPDAERTALRRGQAEYLAIWATALAAVAPDRESADLRSVIEAAHSMIYLVVRSGRPELWPSLPGRLVALGMALLLSA